MGGWRLKSDNDSDGDCLECIVSMLCGVWCSVFSV